MSGELGVPMNTGGPLLPEVVKLGPRAGDQHELARSRLRDGDLSVHVPAGGQHVTDVGQTHLRKMGADK